MTRRRWRARSPSGPAAVLEVVNPARRRSDWSIMLTRRLIHAANRSPVLTDRDATGPALVRVTTGP